MASDAVHDAAYRASVVALQAKTEHPAVLPGVKPAASVRAYHHLGLACRDPSASSSFYQTLGFKPLDGDAGAARGAGIVRLGHASNGLELHLLQADDKSGSDNILMDRPTEKWPGHTHASWAVPSVPALKSFLAGLGVELSGTRSTLAVFVRDPDRTTLEFERNDGKDEPPASFGAEHIGAGKPLDHVGTRLRAPFERHLEWYALNLGFNSLVRRYEPNPDPLKNGPPWITRTAAGCDINWIINANTEIPVAGEASENVLVLGGAVKPGILYAAFSIEETDAAAVLARLQANGADARLDTQLAGWCDLPPDAVRLAGGAPTIMLRDLNGNFVRLVPSPAA